MVIARRPASAAPHMVCPYLLARLAASDGHVLFHSLLWLRDHRHLDSQKIAAYCSPRGVRLGSLSPRFTLWIVSLPLLPSRAQALLALGPLSNLRLPHRQKFGRATNQRLASICLQQHWFILNLTCSWLITSHNVLNYVALPG